MTPTLPPGWKQIEPATWTHADGWVVTVDDDGSTLLGREDDEQPPVSVLGSAGMVMQRVAESPAAHERLTAVA